MGKEIPQNCPLPWVDPDPHLIHGYLGPPHLTCLTPSPPNLPSPQGSRSIIPILYYETAPSPRQNCPFSWGDPDPHLIHGDCRPPHPRCPVRPDSVSIPYGLHAPLLGRISVASCYRSGVVCLSLSNLYRVAQKSKLYICDHNSGKTHSIFIIFAFL